MPFRKLAKAKMPKLPKRKDKVEKLTGKPADLVFNLIKTRRSIQKYKPQPIGDDMIEKLLKAASWAPSAGNSQPWEFIVVRNKLTKKQLAEACFNQEYVAKAPVLIVAGVNTRLAEAEFGERGTKLYGIQGVAAAIENMLILANAMGLGTNWVGAFSEPTVKVLVHFPDYIRPCAIITLGYPDEEPEPSDRHVLKDFVHFETFKETHEYRLD